MAITNRISKEKLGEQYSSFIESFSNIQRLNFRASKDLDLKTINKLSLYKLPNELGIFVDEVQKENEDLRYFLASSTPDNMQSFFFSGSSGILPPWDFYFNGIRVAATKSIRIFTIWLMGISSREFCLLLISARHAKEVSFTYWKLSAGSEYNLGKIEKWEIDELNLSYTGKYSDWKNYPENCISIMQGIANCASLVSSLTKIYLFRSGMSRETRKETFDKIIKIFSGKYSKVPDIKF